MNRRFVPIVLLAAALLLFTIGVASADLLTTNVLRAWDDTTNRYENGNMVMRLNGEPETFYTKLDFDNDLHAGACGVSNPLNTPWAGDAVIDLFHTDNDPAGAEGFQSTSNWKIVRCSTFGTNDTNKYPAAGDILAECVPGNPEDGACVLIGTPDQVVTTACGGNCQDRIQTTFHINTDLACDQTMDEPFATEWSSNPTANNLCLYWEAEKPENKIPYWKGNFQVRYGVGDGGDKTINFSDKFLGPNAVTISALKATAEANRGPLAAWALGLVLAGVAVFVWRRQA